MIDEQGVVCPPPSQEALSPWVLLRLPESAVIDESLIRDRWREQSRLVHPDRFQLKGAEQVAHAQTWCELLNRAYATLRSLHSRLTYLVNHRHPEPDRMATGSSLPPAFLANMFEINELLEMGSAGQLDGRHLQELRQELAAIQSRMAELDQQLQQAGEAWDAGQLDRAATMLFEVNQQRRYLERIEQSASALVHEYESNA